MEIGHEKKKLHIAMFPWLAFGHMIPYLELAKLLAQKGHKISFISTQRNVDRLPKIPQNLSPLINFVKLSLPRDDGDTNLPENAEATVDIPQNKAPYLKKAADGLQGQLGHFLEASSPDWIFYDYAHYWVPSVAGKLGICCAFFSIINAWSVCLLGASASALMNASGDDDDDERLRKLEELLTTPPKWVPFDTTLAFRAYEIKKFLEANPEEAGPSEGYRFACSMSGCDIFVLRSCYEIESEWLKLVADSQQKPVVPTGLLPPLIAEDQFDSDGKDLTWVPISDFLSKQNRGSVVYIALGSEETLNQEQLNELALGLELSGLPFFWALRLLRDDHLVLPDGFEERVRGHGVVWKSWAPQLRILAHDSIGGFVTHCGWSSIIESLYFGHPLVLLPFNVDQGLNAKAMEEKKAGVEIQRDERNGLFTAEVVAKTVRIVVKEDEGMVYREKARELSKMVADKQLHHHRYIDDLIEFLQNYKKG